MFDKTSWLRKAILPWLTLWMIAIPLVHVHPEADHAHGAPAHMHGGTVHTVFSGDLPCEYGYGSTQNERSSGGRLLPPFSPDGSNHALNHPEIAFFFTSLDYREFGKSVPFTPFIFIIDLSPQRLPVRSTLAAVAEPSPLKYLCLPTDHLPRAPPSSIA